MCQSDSRLRPMPSRSKPRTKPGTRPGPLVFFFFLGLLLALTGGLDSSCSQAQQLQDVQKKEVLLAQGLTGSKTSPCTCSHASNCSSQCRENLSTALAEPIHPNQGPPSTLSFDSTPLVLSGQGRVYASHPLPALPENLCSSQLFLLNSTFRC